MIVSCGEALADLLPHPVPGGGPMNVAIAAARLGAPAAYVGRVSTDEHGEMIWGHLVANGVDLRAAQRGPEPTATASVDVGPPLRFEFAGDGTADQALEGVDLSVLGDQPMVVHGGTLALFRGRTAETLATLAEAANGLVSIDPNVRPQLITDRDAWDHFHDRWLRRAHIYKASDEDLEWAFPGREPAAVAAELLVGRAQLVVVTAGAAGATFYTRTATELVPGRRLDVVDTVGAGDTFVASLLVSLSERGLAENPPGIGDLGREELRDVGIRAVASAGMACTREGADPPTRPELDRFLAG